MRCGIARQTSEIETALAEGVNPETRDAGDFEGEVDLVVVGELFELVLVAEERAQSAFGVLGRQDSSTGVERQVTVDAVQRCGAALQVEVGAAPVDELLQRSLDIEHAL